MTSSVSNCDVDIDAAQGIEHVFEVSGDSVKGPTDPYDIHEILLAGQRLDPGYSSVFPQAATGIASNYLCEPAHSSQNCLVPWCRRAPTCEMTL